MLPPRRLRRQRRDRCLGLSLAVVLLAAMVALCTYSSAPLAQRLQVWEPDLGAHRQICLAMGIRDPSAKSGLRTARH